MTPERKLIEAVLDALGETIFPNDSQATRILATPAVQTALAEVRGQGARPQDHWTTVGAIKAARALIKTANDLCFAAETSGGTAGRDAALCAAIDKWAADRDKQKQVLRIIELEGHEPEVGVGYELCPIPPATARAEAAEERVKMLEEALRRQGDNMAFVLNNMDMPDQWYAKFHDELAQDRQALGAEHGK